MKFIFIFLLSCNSALLFGQSYFLNGDAVAEQNDCYTLTSEINNQNGTVWYGQQINLLQPFSIQFTMNLGSIDANGADGICFVLQTVGTQAIGQSGGGMGYLNFGSSLGIEFDTWQNSDYADPFYDHIAIEKNGDINHNSANSIAGPVQADVFDQNIEDGEDHVVRVEWEPSLQRIRVYFDCVFRLQGDVDLIDDIFAGNSLVYWGFTAATGGAYNFQTVCLQPNIVNVGTEVIICQGMQPTLSVGSSLNGIYSWTPPDFLDNPSSPTPVTSTTQDITYTVSFVDLCGDSVVQDVFVNVEELSLSAQVNDVLSCNNNQVLVEFTSNMPMNIAYQITNDQNDILAQGANLTDWIVSAAGSYQILGNVDSMCFATSNFEVTENFETALLDVQDQVILNCAQATALSEVGFSPSGTTFNWTQNGVALTNDNTANLTLTEAGLYVVEAIHPMSGCIVLDSIQVTEDFVAPLIAIAGQDTLSCLQPSLTISGVQVNAAHDYTLSWTSALGSEIIAPNSLTPVVAQSDVYTLTATDLINGCSNEAMVVVASEEIKAIDPSLLVFPNVLTANQDGFNAEWRVFLQGHHEVPQHELFDEWELQIFDRWGHRIAQINSPTQTWSSSDAVEGVYFYTLNAQLLCSGGTIQREGYIHVLR